MTSAEPRGADNHLEALIRDSCEQCNQTGCQHCRWLGTQLALAHVSGAGPRLTVMERLIAAEKRANSIAAEVARLRAALEWYANDRNYSEDTGAAGTFHRIPSTPDQAPGEFVFEPDCGDVARAALGTKGGAMAGEEQTRNRRLKRISADCQVLATAIPKSMPILEKRMARDDVPWLLAELRSLAARLAEAEDVANAAAAFRAADKARMASLRGCVVPMAEVEGAYVATRDAFRRAADTWIAAALSPGAGGEASQ